MIRQLLKLIWNRRRTNFITSLGIFLSFLVLFLVTCFVIYNVKNYFKPLGFDYENVHYINIDWKDARSQEIRETMEQIINVLKMTPEIEAFSFSQSLIFMPSAITNTQIQYKDHEWRINTFQGGFDLDKVLNIQPVKGRWFNEEDRDDLQVRPVIITSRAEKEIFTGESALGKIMLHDDEQLKVVGVIDEFRYGGRFTGSIRGLFYLLDFTDAQGSWGESFGHRILIKLKNGYNIIAESNILNSLNQTARGWSFKIDSLTNLKKSADYQSLAIPLVLVLICTFLLVNIGLGLFGVTWYSTAKRVPEIGLRRALGSSGHGIYREIIGEALVLSTMALIWGSFFVIQFPLLNIISIFDNGIYLISYLISCLIIYLVTIICSLYPSWRAARIEPAQALHYE